MGDFIQKTIINKTIVAVVDVKCFEVSAAVVVAVWVDTEH